MEMQETPVCKPECQKAEQGGDEIALPPPCTTAIKICDCDCDCDCGCCIDRLYSSLKAEPKMWQDHVNNQFAHTRLHDAAAEGQTTLAVEIMNLMPSLGRKLNDRGLSPLHMAIEKGKDGAGAALALTKLDKQLVSIKGRGGLTPLHYAAAAAVDGGEVELGLLAGLLAECPEAIGVLNNRRQTAVHVALECRNVEAARLLVNWLIIVAKESVLSIKDARGNTALHVAAQYCDSRKKGEKDLLQLLIKLVKLYKANNYGETPLDVAIHYRNKSAIEILQCAGATPRNDPENTPDATKKPYASKAVRYLLGGYSDRCAEMLTRSYYFLTKELTMDMRNTILVVAVLIATTTYQGVLQPPGGVYSAEGTGRLVARRRLDHPPGRMVMGTTKYSYFMPTNTLAFISSTLIIIFVLPDRAFVMILQACLIFMCVSYLLALNFISYYNSFSKVLDIVCGATLAVAFALKLVYYFVKAYYNQDEWLLRRLGVMLNNFKARFVGREREDGKFSVLRRMRQQYKLISKRG